MVVDATGKFAYVAASGGIWGYTISAVTGALTPITGSPFGPGGLVAVDPAGKFAYVATFGSIWGYTINATTGALTPIAGSPFAAGPWPRSIAVDPSGRFAYAVTAFYTAGVGHVYGESIDATTGALTPIPGSPFAAAGRPSTSIAISGEIH
jgi:6-phosphogluconolactonase